MEIKIKDAKSSQLTCIMGLILLGCSGCSTLPSWHPAEGVSIPFSQRHKTVNQLQAFKVSGKVGFIQDKKGGSASLDWQQQGQQYQVRLYGPFGSESVTLQGNSQYIVLTRANGQLSLIHI